MHMISCLMVDAEHDMPRQYDLVQGMREMVSKVMPRGRGLMSTTMKCTPA